MKNIILALLLVSLLFGCNKSRPVPEGFIRGVVTETMNAGGYSYMQLEQEDGKTWVASIEMPVAIGDTMYYTEGSMIMKDFHSKTLNKTFDKVVFAEFCTKDPWFKGETKQGGGMMGGKSNPHTSAENGKVNGLEISPEEGGITIEQIYAKKGELNGKTVKVKGQVVKFNAGIMNKNWVHLQDGTGSAADFDLVITTSEVFNIDDIVTFEGILRADKDFGSGYKFSVVIENATSAKVLKKS